MSRIGNMPIAIPEGVEVSVNENLVTVKNGNTVLEQVINPDISVEIGRWTGFGQTT